MESELLEEPSTVPQMKKLDTTKEEDNSTMTFLDWEENFQDLSGWCMDTFQTRCNFPTGEFLPIELSGTKYDSNGVSTVEEPVLENMMNKRADEDKQSFKMNPFEDIEVRNNKNNKTLPLHILHTTSNNRKEVKDAKANESSLTCWLRLPKTNAATESKENTTTLDVNASLHSQHQQHVGDLDLEDTCHNTFVSIKDQPEPWDMLRNVQTDGADTFDLISYIYEDELDSPTGSTSTKPSTVVKSRPPNQQSLPATVHNVRKAIKTEETVCSVPRTIQTRSTSTSTSSSDTSTGNFSYERADRSTDRVTRTATATSKVTKRYNGNNSEKHENRGRKRPFEDDDTDSRMATVSYRESREKNNEASRKSRMNKKAKETEMALRAVELEKDNRILKMRVEELEKLVTSMRNALLRSALKKN